MDMTDLSLRNTKESNLQFAWGNLPGRLEVLETRESPESALHAELQREKARLKLLLEVTKQAVSNQELRDVMRAVMMSIRNGILCDGVCIYLESPEDEELQVYALDFPGNAEFQEGTTIPLFGTIAGYVIQNANPWSGTREEACARFPRQVLLSPGFTTGCMLPIPGPSRVLGALGLVRSEDNSFGEDEIEFLAQVANQIAIAVENALACRQIRELKEQLTQKRVYVQNEIFEISDETHFEDIVGKSAALRRVLAKVETVAPTDATVLICGETGTGKELIAHAIHNLSPRRDHTFVRMNCAAIPSGLLESELFGHEKGAFTGALLQKKGRFELADHGSLFLDEIGDISLELQPKLLRAVQEREFERLGSARTIQVNVRMIAATHRDLPTMIREGKFREDLFYRLNVFPIEIPPLRERREDIPLLVNYFVSQLARRMGKKIESIPRSAMEALANASWPGNVRQLQNFLERAVILTQGSELYVPSAELNELAPAARVNLGSGVLTFHDAERQTIIGALKAASGKIAGAGGAAERLGLKRTTLQNKMRRLKVSRAEWSQEKDKFTRAV